MSKSRTRVFILSSAFLFTACSGNNASMSSDSTSSETLIEDATSADLAVGQVVHVAFSAGQPATVTEVAVFQGEMAPGLGFGRGPHGGGPGGMMGDHVMGGPGAACANDATTDATTDATAAPADSEADPAAAGRGPCGQPPVDDGAVRGMVRGAVESVDADAATVTVIGVVVHVDDNTTFDGVAALADLAAGMSVKVMGKVDVDGNFVALVIRAEAPELVGTISAVTTDPETTITILGRTLTLGADTKIVTVTPPQHGNQSGPGGGRHGGNGGRGGGHGPGGHH